MNNNDKRKNNNSLRFNLILSIIIAISGWTYVVYEVSPNIDRIFTEVPITFTGEYDLSDAGLGVKSSEISTVDVTVSMKRSVFSEYDASDIVAVCDVTDAKNGENTLPITISVPQALTLKKQSDQSVTIHVADSSTKDVPVLISYAGNVADNQEPLATELSYEDVSIFGASKNVEKVAYAMLKVDASKVTTSENTYTFTPVAMDKNGNIVEHIVVLPSEIGATVTSAICREVTLNVTVTDNSTDGLTRNTTVPKTITIKGSKNALGDIDKIDATCDITNIANSGSLELNYNLPDGVAIANNSFGQKLKLEVK
ncbi:MAG: hypothetical protein GX852_03465 [Clostridiales bacterium]|jgi:YbbR domain-containing protein|nr:hypothetical protein [Clostridiales bacterium]